MKYKKSIFILTVFLLSFFLLIACGNSNSEKTLVEQIDDQLTGTWISCSSDSVIQKYTFYDGRYIAEVYIDGQKIDNPTIGTYTIGTDAIHTVTIDQANIVEGSIPFSYENDVLELIGHSGKLEKEK